MGKRYIRRSSHNFSLFWLYPLVTSHFGKEMLQTLHTLGISLHTSDVRMNFSHGASKTLKREQSKAREVPDQKYSVGSGSPHLYHNSLCRNGSPNFHLFRGNFNQHNGKLHHWNEQNRLCIFQLYLCCELTHNTEQFDSKISSFANLKEEKTRFPKQMRRLEVFLLFCRAVVTDKDLGQKQAQDANQGSGMGLRKAVSTSGVLSTRKDRDLLE